MNKNFAIKIDKQGFVEGVNLMKKELICGGDEVVLVVNNKDSVYFIVGTCYSSNLQGTEDYLYISGLANLPENIKQDMGLISCYEFNSKGITLANEAIVFPTDKFDDLMSVYSHLSPEVYVLEDHTPSPTDIAYEMLEYFESIVGKVSVMNSADARNTEWLAVVKLKDGDIVLDSNLRVKLNHVIPYCPYSRTEITKEVWDNMKESLTKD